MAKKKRHSRVEIATKLAQANGLATQGKLQSEIARTLGVSVMTLHRWRKAPPGAQPAHETGEPGQTRGGGDRIAELQLENSRLRRLVTDLLLEKINRRDGPKRASRQMIECPFRKLHRSCIHIMQPRLGQSVIIEIGQVAARAIWHRATLESQA
jgi:putative transposase